MLNFVLSEASSIESAEDLLTCLRQAPTKRWVQTAEEPEDEDTVCALILEGERVNSIWMSAQAFHDDPAQPASLMVLHGGQDRAHIVGRIAVGSEAESLLNQAFDLADKGQDEDVSPASRQAWETLSVRYGPMCSTWTLPEHPQAQKQFDLDPTA